MDLARRLAPVITLAAIALAGLIGAIAAEHLTAALAFAALLLGNLARVPATLRTPLTLRDDLSVWVAQTAAVTGETDTDTVNRAIARLRAGFSPHHEPERGIT